MSHVKSRAEVTRHGDELCDVKVKARGTVREQAGVGAAYRERTGGLGKLWKVAYGAETRAET